MTFLHVRRPTFETLSANLESYDTSIPPFVDGRPAVINYTTPSGGTISKTITYNAEGLPTTITLSGDIKGGVQLTKSVTYSPAGEPQTINYT